MNCSKWISKEIKEIGQVITGKTPSTTKQENFGDKYLFITPRDMTEQKKITFTERKLSQEGANILRKQLIKGPAICVSCIGSDMGKVVVCENDFVTNQQINTISNIKDEYNIDFIYYSLLQMRDYLHGIAGGSTMPIVNKSTFEAITLSIPSIKEQRKIAKILSSLDEKIELNNEMNKTLEEMSQVLFKRWFVDFEFPNEEGKPYKSSGGEMIESELGIIPVGWRYGTIQETSNKIFSGGTPKTSEETYWNGQLSWMSSGETRNNFIVSTEKSITDLGAQKSSTRLANKYDTVIASAGQGFTRGQTSMLLIDTYINQSLIAINSNQYFRIFNYINIKMRYNELRSISDSHSIRGSLTTKMIAALNTIIPTNEILIKFNELINPIICNIENNINNSNDLTNLRDSLLPKLMSGEIRVEDVEANL